MDKNKKKIIIHYNNLSPEVLDALREAYPDGHMHHIFKVTKPNNDFFYAVTLDTEDTSYLIKVDVKIDNITEDKLDDALFSNIEGIKPTGKEEEEMGDDDEEESPKPDKDKDEIF